MSDSRGDPHVAQQIAVLDATRAALTKRTMTVLTEAQPGSRLRQVLGVPAHGFAVVLAGKDGSVKQVWRAPVDPTQIFVRIDAMPMRQRQMRGRPSSPR